MQLLKIITNTIENLQKCQGTSHFSLLVFSIILPKMSHKCSYFADMLIDQFEPIFCNLVNK